MNVVCYGCPLDKTSRMVWENIQKAVPDLGLELYGSPESLISRLRHPSRINIAVAILYIENPKALSDLLNACSLLHDLPVAIVLTRWDADIVRLSHEFRPRVIMDTGWKTKDFCSVLERCIKRSCRQRTAHLPRFDLQNPQEIRTGGKTEHAIRADRRNCSVAEKRGKPCEV